MPKPATVAHSAKPQPAQPTKADSRRVLVIVVAIAVILRLLLVATLPVQAMTQTIHDDALFLHQGASIAHGQWLGPYDQTTLIKGVGYPLFIAACSLVHFPLKLAEHGVYVIACLLMLIALRPVIPSIRTRLIIFLILLFNPMTVDSWMNRELREGIYAAQTLLVFACAIGMALRFDSKLKSIWPWLVATGVSLGWFWITREEGAWIVPSVTLIFAVCGFTIWQKNRQLAWIAYAGVPPLVLLTVGNGICYLNWRHYGVWEMIELKSPEVQSAYGALTRVKPDHFDPLVPMSRETREKLYPVSPAFAELRPFLEGSNGGMWAALGATELSNLNGEIAGGWFIFALRDAVALAGHSHSATDARAFYARLATEVNDACDNGSLPALPRRSSLAPPWNNQYIPLMRRSALHGVAAVAAFENLDIDVDPSVGTAAALDQFRDITHCTPTPADTGASGPQSTNLDDNIYITIWQFIGVAYQYILPIAAAIAALVFLVQVALLAKGYRSLIFAMELATLMLIVARVAMMSFFDVAFFPAINTRYLAPAYPMVLLFAGLALAEGINVIAALRKITLD